MPTMKEYFYKTFMKHAKKVTRNAKEVSPTREVLQGVFHREDGKLVVTDSHRLYLLKDVYEGEEKIIDPVKNIKIEGRYPEIDKLLPRSEPNFKEVFDVNEYLRATDIVNTAGIVSDTVSVMKYEHNTLSCNIPEAITAEYGVTVTIPSGYTFHSNAQYWVDALKMFKAFKYTKVVFEFYGRMRPFTLTSPDDMLLALILPVRSF